MKSLQKMTVRELKKARSRASEMSSKCDNRLRDVRHEIERRVEMPRLEKLVGCYFKGENRYSTGKSWYIYIKVAKLDGAGLVVDRFQTDCHGMTTIKREQHYPEAMLDAEITQKEYEREHAKMLHKVRGIK